MGWDRGWVTAFPTVPSLAWGMEYDRPAGWLQGVYVCLCVCVCLYVRVCDVCMCVCVYDHVRMCKCVVCMCAFVYVNYNELIHSPQHTTLCTDTSQHIILPTLHHTLHPPHRNLNRHCRSSNPGWWQSSFRANSWKTAALLRTTLLISSNQDQLSFTWSNLYSDSLSW